ncbi:hypothetical protein [Celeribacter arenosi]|uniref:Uncharacterized protein n=1 Tax=Celeribacter arenosi TaxID=792649 RepID=A0ABP7K808_9RHOB
MLKTAVSAVFLSGLAIFFIVTKSDGLRHAAQTGDASHLQQTESFGSALANATGTGDYAIPDRGWDPYAPEPWYRKLDPRKLWRGGSKTIKVTPTTMSVSQEDRDLSQHDIEAQLLAKGLSASGVVVRKLE